MSFTEQANQIFNQAIRDYHLTDNVDTPINDPYDRESIEYRLYRPAPACGIFSGQG